MPLRVLFLLLILLLRYSSCALKWRVPTKMVHLASLQFGQRVFVASCLVLTPFLPYFFTSITVWEEVKQSCFTDASNGAPAEATYKGTSCHLAV